MNHFPGHHMDQCMVVKKKTQRRFVVKIVIPTLKLLRECVESSTLNNRMLLIYFGN